VVDLFSNAGFTAALVFVAVALGSVSIALIVEWGSERRRQRAVIDALRKHGDALLGEDGETLLRGGAKRQAVWAQRLAARTPRLQDIGLMIQQAGLTWGLDSFLLLSVGLAVALGFAVLLVTRFPALSVFGAALGAYLPYFYVKRKAIARINAFEGGLPEAIDLLGRAIRAGHPLSSGMKMVADETQEPIAGEFQRTFEEQRFGLPFDDAVQAMADRVNLVDVRILVTAILIQREVGGNLAEVLDNIASVIRARFTIRRQLRVYTAQGRFSGYVLAVLPIAVGTIIYMLNPEYMSILWTHKIGKLMLVTAIVLQLIGYAWIRKIINIEI
jgi:tight adherence protein B